MIAHINFILAGMLAAICAWTDMKSMTIYNRHTYPAAVIGTVYSIATAQYSHLYGALVVFAMYLFLFILAGGKLGGGDLKLAVALSLFLGMEPVICGSILAGLVLMAWGFASTWHRTGQVKAGVMVALGRLPGGAVPYGAVLGPTAILAAVFIY
ncbi:MAG: prepilin peptidase [Peptococcaceae bacterium]|nr:prepilin peptidase [Peptococcaceae bacterium]